MGDYLSVTEFAKFLGISTVAVRKRIKKGQIEAIRIGRNFAIPRKYIDEIRGKALSNSKKKVIEDAVKRTITEYGEVLKKLGST